MARSKGVKRIGILTAGSDGPGLNAAIRAVGTPGTRWEELGLKVSASIGTASFPVDGADADEVLLAADRALRRDWIAPRLEEQSRRLTKAHRLRHRNEVAGGRRPIRRARVDASDYCRPNCAP